MIMTAGQLDHLSLLLKNAHAASYQQTKLIQAASGIDRADGTVPAHTRAWIRALDGWATENVDDSFVIELAKQTSTGDLLEEVRRWGSAEHGCITTWPEMKKKICEQFLSACETLKLQAMLENARQKEGETVSAYVRRFRADTTRAYPDDRPATEENRVVASFLRGFRDRQFTERLFRTGKVKTLDEAIATALEKEAERERLEQVLKTGEERMEVDTVDSKVTSMLDTVQRRLEQLNTRIAKVEAKGKQSASPSTSGKAVVQTPPNQQRQNQQKQQQPKINKRRKDPRHQWTDDGKPICAYCSKPGHLYRECRKRQREVGATDPTSSGGR